VRAICCQHILLNIILCRSPPSLSPLLHPLLSVANPKRARKQCWRSWQFLTRSGPRSDFRKCPELDPDLKKFLDKFFLKCFTKNLLWIRTFSKVGSGQIGSMIRARTPPIFALPEGIPNYGTEFSLNLLTIPWWRHNYIKIFCPTLSLKNQFHVTIYSFLYNKTIPCQFRTFLCLELFC
jgi:hypothetical protein